MTRWDEEHFLDTIMPLLAERAVSEHLPGDQAPSPGVNGEYPGETISLRGLKSFPARDLALRLQRFDQAAGDPPDQDWEHAEERLDQWMCGFLASARVNSHRQSAERLPAKTRNVGFSGFFYLTRWILIPAAVCSVIAISFLAGRRSLTPRGQEVAVNRVPVQSIPVVATPPAPKNTRPESEPSGAQDVASTTAHASRSNPELPISRNAQATPSVPEFLPTPSSTGTSSESASETEADARSNQLARAPGSATATEAATSRQLANEHPGMPVAVRAARSINVNSNPVASVPAPRQNVPIRNLIQLEAGTRVWISLKSVRRQSEFLSEFDGTLLLPVTQSGTTVLDRDTPVFGTISTVGGKTTIQIQELQLNGARYELASVGRGMTLPTANTNKMVDFDAGKVIETFVSSASTYSRRAEGQAPPKP